MKKILLLAPFAAMAFGLTANANTTYKPMDPNRISVSCEASKFSSRYSFLKVSYKVASGSEVDLVNEKIYASDCDKNQRTVQNIRNDALLNDQWAQFTVTRDSAGNFYALTANSVAKPAEPAKEDKKIADRANSFGKFECHFPEESLNPARTVNLKGCNAGIFLGPVVCTEGEDGVISTTVACSSANQKNAKKCYEESISQTYVHKTGDNQKGNADDDQDKIRSAQ